MRIAESPNIWDLVGEVGALCIPTNCSYMTNGQKSWAVMGAGLAKQARDRYAQSKYILGEQLEQGNIVPIVMAQEKGTAILSFPTKPGDRIVNNYQEVMPQFRKGAKIGLRLEGWKFYSDLNLIYESIAFLHWKSKIMSTSVAIPKVGSGLGGLDWDMVKNVILDACDGDSDFLILAG